MNISPITLLVIVILAIAFFVIGLLQLLIRCLMKRPSLTSISQSNRFLPDNSSSYTFQRQLQQLFKLQDSGLDQTLIESLPVFHYKDIIGSKEPFDCAVCLCEFSNADKLKYLPNCSHAFHVQCIDTWLMTNSTCPLCRRIISDNNCDEPHFFDFNESIIKGSSADCDDGILQGNAVPSRVFSIRLGKFRNLVNEGFESGDKELTKEGITSSSSSGARHGIIDDRRCYSMGNFQYVVDDTNLRVALFNKNGARTKVKAPELIDHRSRNDSFSVSKIWLWSDKGKSVSSMHGHGSHLV